MRAGSPVPQASKTIPLAQGTGYSGDACDWYVASTYPGLVAYCQGAWRCGRICTVRWMWIVSMDLYRTCQARSASVPYGTELKLFSVHGTVRDYFRKVEVSLTLRRGWRCQHHPMRHKTRPQNSLIPCQYFILEVCRETITRGERCREFSRVN